jgi:hypothetical protein
MGDQREGLIMRKVTVTKVDDLDGSSGAETIYFALDGVDFEIDLAAANGVRLRKVFEQYVKHGRREVGRGSIAPAGGTRVTRKRGPADAMAYSRQVRDWARTHGHDVADRGRMPKAVIDAFKAANQVGRRRPGDGKSKRRTTSSMRRRPVTSAK